MANPIKLTFDECETSKMFTSASGEHIRCFRMSNGSWGYFRSQGPNSFVGMRRYSIDKPTSDEEKICATSEPRTIQELENISPRIYSIDELKSIGEDGLWDQGHWVSWHAKLALGGLRPSPTSSSHNKKDENKTLIPVPATPRIKSLNEVKSVETAGASDDGDGIRLSSPAMLEMERATKSTSAISFSDDEGFYSAYEQESRGQGHEFIAPTISVEEGCTELYKWLNLERQKSIAAQSPVKSPEPVVPPTDSDIESLKSISEPGSDIESWVNEPTTSELEAQLQEKHELSKKLFSRLQAAEAQLEGLKRSHEKQLQERHRAYSNLADGHKGLYKSLKDASKENLLACEVSCHRLLNVAEKNRLAELAEVEEKILKCNDDWTIERKSLIAKLEAQAKSSEDWTVERKSLIAKLEAKSKAAGVIVKEYEELNWQATEAQSQLKAITDLNGKWWMTESAKLLPKKLSLGKIAGVIDELRMKLHDLVSAEKAQKKSTSTLAVDHMIAGLVFQKFEASNYSAAQWARVVEALVHPKADCPQGTVKVGTGSSSSQDQSTAGLPPSARALSSRLLKATNENRELKTRLQGDTEKHATIDEKSKVLLHDNTAIQEHAERVEDESHNVPCYCQKSQEDDKVEVPVSTLKTQVRNLRQQIIEITEEKKTDKEMHGKLRCHYFSLHKKYSDFASTPESILAADLKGEIASLNEAGSTTVLECPKEALKEEIIYLTATQKSESKLRNAINSSLAAKYNSLSEHHTQLKADYQSTKEAQKVAETRQKELQQHLIDHKVSMENMKEVQKARYNVLETRFSSLSSQKTAPKSDPWASAIIVKNGMLEKQLQDAKGAYSKYVSLLQAHAKLQADLKSAQEIQKQLVRSRDEMEIERNSSKREKKWLESRVEEMEHETKMVRNRCTEASRWQQDLSNLNYKLKSDNAKLVGSHKGAKEIQIYLGGKVNDLSEQYKQSIAANNKLRCDHDTLQNDHATLRASHEKLEKAWEKLEKAYEIAQKAHKVLENRLQKANLTTFGLEKRLNEIQGLDTWSNTLVRQPRHPTQVTEEWRREDAREKRRERKEPSPELRPSTKAQHRAHVAIFGDFGDAITTDSDSDSAQRVEEEPPIKKTDASDVGSSPGAVLDAEDISPRRTRTVTFESGT
jgi:hypothetical protein